MQSTQYPCSPVHGIVTLLKIRNKTTLQLHLLEYNFTANHTPKFAFQHASPNSAITGYAIHRAFLMSAQLSTDTLSAPSERLVFQ